MALDINDGYKTVKEKVSTTQKYKDIKKDADDLKKRKGESLETAKKYSSEQLSSLKKKRDKFEQDRKDAKKNQFDQLLDLTKILSKGGEKSGQTKTVKYLKKVFVTAIAELKPQIKDILNSLGTNAIGCAQDQTYVGDQSLYLKVKSFDLTNFLKEEPESSVGKITYEKESIQYGTFPFSFNKSLYDRMQNINQPYSVPSTLNYVGTSGQQLFDITYVESYVDPIVGLVQGNFYKIDLKNRESNKIIEFLEDYYNTIEVVDFKNIFANLINQLTGSLSIKKGDGDVNLGDLNKVLLILKRILGLCFDATTEIDVSGVSKVSEFDNIDKSFFEFTEIDLRIIDQKVSDIKLGIVEFEECGTVKLPVDVDSIISSVDELNYVDGKNNNNTINDAANITDTITNGFFPLKINIDLDFLKEFPKALVMAILSPKVILPIMIMAKSIGQTFVDDINSFMDFAKKLKTYFSELVSKIAALFVKIIFDIIKKDIKLLIAGIISDIANEKTKKRTAMILSLVALIMSIAKLIKDFRECKSIINDLQALLAQIQSTTEQLPLPLLLATKLRKGYSKTGAFLNVISEFEKLGLPTGPMPDGSPNLTLISIKAIIDGIDKETTENGRVDIGIGPLSVTPLFQTIPKSASGLFI
jgi:hypothetical protein